MASPTASPQVASTVGLKNVVIAPLIEDSETTHTYGTVSYTHLDVYKRQGNSCKEDGTQGNKPAQ